MHPITKAAGENNDRLVLVVVVDPAWIHPTKKGKSNDKSGRIIQ